MTAELCKRHGKVSFTFVDFRTLGPQIPDSLEPSPTEKKCFFVVGRNFEVKLNDTTIIAIS